MISPLHIYLYILQVMIYNSFKRFFSGVHACVNGDDALTN